MAVLADKEIISLCTKPTHLVYDVNGTPTELISPPYTPEQMHLIKNWHSYADRPYAVPLEEVDNWKPVIDNFEPTPVRYVHKETGEGRTIVSEGELDQFKKVISYGVTSYGYDVRITNDINEIKIFSNINGRDIDPKRIVDDNFATPFIREDEEGSQYVLIPPHSYLQAPTVEYFRIPKDILVTVLGKSTYARSGLVCNVTPIEPEFEGKVTLQITNVTNSHLRVYLGEGIAKLIFTTIGL